MDDDGIFRSSWKCIYIEKNACHIFCSHQQWCAGKNSLGWRYFHAITDIKHDIIDHKHIIHYSTWASVCNVWFNQYSDDKRSLFQWLRIRRSTGILTLWHFLLYIWNFPKKDPSLPDTVWDSPGRLSNLRPPSHLTQGSLGVGWLFLAPC